MMANDLLHEEQEALNFQRLVGRNLRFWRQQRGMELADFARRCGRPATAIAEIESGEAMAGLELLWRAAKVLRVPCLAFTDSRCFSSAA